MKRATTPTHTFTLPFNYDGVVDKLLLSYAQSGNIVLEKTEKQVKVKNEKEIVVRLTQEETNLFSEDAPVKIQMRILTIGGDAMASDPFLIQIEEVLNDEVLE